MASPSFFGQPPRGLRFIEAQLQKAEKGRHGDLPLRGRLPAADCC
jgi:hypothetical protein